MTTEQENIIQLALAALRTKCAMSNKEVYLKEDAENIVMNILGTDFICDIKPNITAATIRHIGLQSEHETIFVTKYVNPNMLDSLAAEGIKVLDACGNFYIRHSVGNNVAFQLTNRGEKNLFAKEKLQPVFQEAGLRLIFFLLQNHENVSLPYRAMQNATGISLGSVKNIIETLTASHYIMVKAGKRVLKNTDALEETWITEYARTLKPKLLLGRMSFRSAEEREEWNSISLPDGMVWGGECGANIIDGYLTPGSFEIYSDVAITKLMKCGKVRIDADGDIAIYRKFWTGDVNTEENTAPIFLLYADLLGQGSTRCLEAAERLKKYGFDNKQ